MARFCHLQLLVVYYWVAATKCEHKDVVRLRKDLLRNYDKNLRPVVKDNETTVVKFAFHLNYLLHLDERTDTLTCEGYYEMEWTDDHLKWEPSQYGNLKNIAFGDQEIWQPDIHLMRSSGESPVAKDKPVFAYVTSKGLVRCWPPANLKVPCTANYTYFPFEIHLCEFQFESWNHAGDTIHLLPFENYTIYHDYLDFNAWNISSWSFDTETLEYEDVPPFNMLHLRLYLQRISSLHKITSVVPVFASSLLTLAGFWLDIWSAPRYVLGIGNFAVAALQLLHLGKTLPAGHNIPLLAQFSATAVSVSAIFVILTSLLDSMQRRRRAPPERLLRLCLSLPERLVNLHGLTNLQSEGREKDKVKGDWLLVCRVTDRVAFWVFTVIYVVIAFSLFSVA